MRRCPMAEAQFAELAEALGRVREEDGAPLAITWDEAMDAIRDLRAERDEWEQRAKAAPGFVPVWGRP